MRLNLELLDQLPKPVKIFLYRQVIKQLKGYVLDTRTPVDDFALRVFGQLVAEALNLEPPDNLKLNDHEKPNE